MPGGERTERRGEAKERREGLSRIESELDLRLGIKTFETSTGQQDRLQLNHSSSLVSSSIPPSRLSDVPSPPPPSSFPPRRSPLPPPPLLAAPSLCSLQLQLPRPLLSSLSSPCPHGPIGPGIPSQASSGLVSSLSLLRYRVLISEPLGFTWRALMTSRNERVPPSSNKRLFHVPMLILQESRRFPNPLSFFLPVATFRLFFFPRARSR